MREISIHIATWNRKKMLIALIESLQDQSINHELYEICICDSNSDDGTNEAMYILMRKYGNINYYNIETNTPAAKRNYLLSNTELPIIISLDDDLVVDRNFIKAHYECQKKVIRSLICGQVRFPKELIENSNYYRFRDSNHIKKGSSKLNLEDIPAKNIVTMNMSFKRSEVKTIGYMNENFVNYGGEDVEFGYRVKKHDFKILYLEDALAYHWENSKLEGYLHKLYISARYSSRLLLDNQPDVLVDSKIENLRPINQSDKKNVKLKKLLLIIILNKFINKLLISFLIYVDRKTFLYFPVLYSYICAFSIKKGFYEQKKSDKKETWL